MSQTLTGGGARACPGFRTEHRFEVVPDWVYEVLSASTESKDREITMPIYARTVSPMPG